MRRWTVLFALSFACIFFLARSAAAHVRSESWSTWTVRGDQVDVRLRISLLDLSAVAWFAELAAGASGDLDQDRRLADYLQRRLRVEPASGQCAVDPNSYQRLAGEPGFIVRAWSAHCPADTPLRITTDLLLEEVPTHLHFATLARNGTSVAERLLTGDARSWDIGGDPGAVSSARLVDFIALGIRHVATGLDHIVFVLTLLVVAGSLRAVAGVVTGFTLGHSATLALAVLGGVRPDVSATEALVGASIAVVAVENVWLEERDPWIARGLLASLALIAGLSAATGRGAPLALTGLAIFVACYFGLLARSQRPVGLRWAVAALFGTVHGFAFSGALAEMHLPRQRLATALFGFNVGVEIAQLSLVVLVWPLWRRLARTHVRGMALVLASSCALCAGTFWLIDRTFV